ncbi:hypothetical protein MLD38_024520 [Melastoma candidum]|uniref:Uncharacterized protein n=1 Tax=Melastoma candidum TaxID=119954 RepID=A0ACB9NS92_9MYRT|nr:hypothetical protein MLD38_024520 [Melastoma candidum]
MARSTAATGATLGPVRLVSIPDGMETQEERDTPGKLSEAVLRVLPRKFEELIEEIVGEDDEGGIECVVADQSLGWALDIATRKGIRTAAFCPASAAQLVVALCIPKLIADGIINEDGIPIGKQRFELAEGVPELSTEDLVWTRLGNETMQRHIFQLMLNNTNSTSSAQLILCNSALDLELGAFLASPRKLLPIGPLCTSPSSPSVDSKDNGRAIVARHEIKEKVDKVYGDEGYRSRALEMKGMVRSSVGEGGMSHENFEYFVDWIKRV